MTDHRFSDTYFPYDIQISSHHWSTLDLGSISRLISERGIPRIIFYRQVAARLNAGRPGGAATVHAAELNLYAALQRAFRYLVDLAADRAGEYDMVRALKKGGLDPDGTKMKLTAQRFVELFPPDAVLNGNVDGKQWLTDQFHAAQRTRHLLREMLLLKLAADNPAIDSFRELVDDRTLAASSHYLTVVTALDRSLKSGPPLAGLGQSLIDALTAAIAASPASLAGQVRYLRQQWHDLLPAELIRDVDTAFDILLEEERERGWGGDPGPPPVMEFGRGGAHGGMAAGEDGSSVFGGYDYPEHEAFSTDADWMPNVVLMAKMVYVWLDQLSKQYGYAITRLDQVPDVELATLSRRGFTGLWLIGVWERSVASRRIKQLCGNDDAIASAYSLYDYEIAADLGGWEALASLRQRALANGIRLASDMVPNHTGIYSRWVMHHPDWFVQTDYPPFPTYQFNGEDLSHSEHAVIQVEDGYWTKTDAAVVFRMIEHSTGRTRYIYHGNDGTSIPWNDTAQLNYLLPEVREAVVQTILHVARNFPIIRFDAAMTLAKKHYQRLWFPIRGLGGGIPSRAEHGMSRDEFDALFPVEFWREVVDRVAAEAPGTLLLAEAFWMMEGYFVRTLGMHRVYNSAFMNMLKKEENAKYRQTIRNVLEFNPEVLQRFVNFMNNPDEKTAVAQFGSQGKYFGACLLMATMPGLPMFGHGQIEGFQEKYGMEYKRAYWDEQPDEGLVQGHEMWIFPLLRKRWLFSGAENFAFYDFCTGEAVDENVYAYSNRVGDQRALVLYHNSHARTAGWVRESTSLAVKTGVGEEFELQRTTLCRSLGIHDEENLFVTFRDLTGGLEYIRSAHEMAARGLFAELEEYHFHVFLDFSEIRDDLDGSWRKLFLHLKGAGVASLEDERKQMMYAKLNCAFAAVLQQAVSDEMDVSLVTSDTAAQSLEAFYAEATHLANPIPKPRTICSTKHAPLSSLKSLASLRSVKTKATYAVLFQQRLSAHFSDTASRRLLLSWFLLRSLSIDPRSFGLDYTLRRLLQGSEAGFIHRSAALLSALLELSQAAAASRQTTPEYSVTQAVVTLHSCRRYLLTHESGGIEWFNKERFEELCAWLILGNLLDTFVTAATTQTSATRMTDSEAFLENCYTLATAAGYRSLLFTDLFNSASGTAARAPRKPTAASKSKTSSTPQKASRTKKIAT
ncbi:MAG TPA: alpha-amylase [Desulfuromonadales bacterium]|nr:alpha-amylase [Desulfuromonadales bacterium]